MRKPFVAHSLGDRRGASRFSCGWLDAGGAPGKGPAAMPAPPLELWTLLLLLH